MEDDYKAQYKLHTVAVWNLTFYLIDNETGDPVLNDDGSVKEFHADDYVDCDFIANGLDLDDLEEIVSDENVSNENVSE
jgi:hypothetical protein